MKFSLQVRCLRNCRTLSSAHLLPSHDTPRSPFQPFSSPPPCCSTQLNSTSPLFPSPVLLPLHSPPPCSALLLCSHLLSSRLPSLSFSSVRFVLWLQRLNLLAKHAKSRARRKKSTHIFHRLLRGPRCIPGLRSACQKKKKKKKPVQPGNPVPLQQIHARACFSTPSLELNLIAHILLTEASHLHSIKRLTRINHRGLIIN